jgi:hypothetical protein
MRELIRILNSREHNIGIGIGPTYKGDRNLVFASEQTWDFDEYDRIKCKKTPLCSFVVSDSTTLKIENGIMSLTIRERNIFDAFTRGEIQIEKKRLGKHLNKNFLRECRKLFLGPDGYPAVDLSETFKDNLERIVVHVLIYFYGI